MTDRPIIFSAPMVLALLREIEKPGTGKTQTRRLAWRMAKSYPGIECQHGFDGCPMCNRPPATHWQKVHPGDRLWVKETHWRYGRWAKIDGKRRWIPVVGSPAYLLEEPREMLKATKSTESGWHKWPSIYLPRECSRITLEVTATKIEPLQSISEKDARAEGAFEETLGIENDGKMRFSHRAGFCNIWCALHGPESWDENPEVCAITFKPHLCNVEDMPK